MDRAVLDAYFAKPRRITELIEFVGCAGRDGNA
jgi:hypothetical protein